MNGRRRVRGADLLRLLVSWLLAFLALLLTAWVLPGFTYASWTPLVVAAAATGLVGMIVRPLLVELAAAIGWIAVALATLFGQALEMLLALWFVPGVHRHHIAILRSLGHHTEPARSTA